MNENFQILQSKTYDSVTEKYMDFSFEKTNSAYMLFYERRLPEHLKQRQSELLASPTSSSCTSETIEKASVLKEDEELAVKTDGNEAGKSKKSDTEMANRELNNSQSEKPESSNCDTANNEPQASTSAAAAATAAYTKSTAEVGVKSTRMSIPILNKELEDWIWQDNRQFLQDRNIFEHTYFK